MSPIAEDRARYVFAGLVGLLGAALLGSAWRDVIELVRSTLLLLGAYTEGGSLSWDGPPRKIQFWYDWLTHSNGGPMVVAAVGACSCVMSAVAFPKLTSDAASTARIAIATTALLVSAALLAAGPAFILNTARVVLEREVWNMYRVWSATVFNSWTACGSVLLASWVVAVVSASRVSLRMARAGALLTLIVGSIASYAIHGHVAPAARENAFPLCRWERTLPRTPANLIDARPWKHEYRGGYWGVVHEPNPVRAAIDFDVLPPHRWTILNPTRDFPRDTPFATGASASIAGLRPWLDRLGEHGVANLQAVTIVDTATWRSPTFGDVHLGTRTLVTLSIACLGALADDVIWGDAVARCASVHRGTGPLMPPEADE